MRDSYEILNSMLILKSVLKESGGGVMTVENIAMLIASLLLFAVGIKLGEERVKGEKDIE